MDVRLIPPTYVKPYVQRQKNDAADAAAICEAVSRPHMRHVPIKTEEQQGVLVLHRARDLLTRQRTMIINAIRAHLAEFGIVAPQGPRHVAELIECLKYEESTVVPGVARRAILAMAAQLGSLVQQIRALERELLVWHRANAASQQLATIPGVGIITATALAASVSRSRRVQIRTSVCGFPGTSPTAELIGRQKPAGAHLQDGQRLFEKAPGGWRDICTATCPDQRSQQRSLAARAHRAQTRARRDSRYRQQDRANRMGLAQPRRQLSARRRLRIRGQM
jgi:transposase